ncbi:MAG: 2OG-Fe(II) oxygenase family protein [Gammaproteobacteria bacterium]
MSEEGIPVIDLADPEAAGTVRAVGEACREWGFFQAVGHGVDPRLIASVQRRMRAFFAQPLDAKRAIVRSAQNPWGFYDRELTRHTPDWKQIYDVGPASGDSIVPQWPATLPEFRPAIEAFRDACNAVSMRILRAISLSLGMPAGALDGCFRAENTSFLRLNYYPECPTPERPTDASVARVGHLGVNQHTDAGAVTVLFQDRPGLEVFHEERWKLIEPRRDAFVINIGDIAQVWSNDLYRAALHRALVRPDVERFTTAFFLNPPYSADYAPLPSVIDAGHPARYRAIKWGEFRSRRTAGDYANQGEYAQISQYYFSQSAR